MINFIMNTIVLLKLIVMKDNCCEVINMIDYTPMWNYMKSRDISQYYLLKHGIDNKTLYNIKRNENITLLTLEKLCKALNCSPNDIVRFTD